MASASSSVTVLASDAVSSLSLTKSTTSTGYGKAGDTIPYSYLVTNTGTTTESNISVSRQPGRSVTCPDTPIAPNASLSCSGTYTVTQADVDAGSVTNTATASGTNPQGATVASASSSVTVLASNAVSSLSLTKSTTSTGYGKAGDTIPYSYLVTNTGTTTESNISVSDNKVSSVTCPDTPIAPNASLSCSGTYTVTQADVDAGSVTNRSRASGTNPQGVPVLSTFSSFTVAATGATSSLSLSMTTTTHTYTAAGQHLSYSLVLTNTGTTTLSDLGASGSLAASVSCPSSVAPGASKSCTESHTVTQADVNAGSVTNTVTANGTSQLGVVATSAPSSVAAQYTGIHINSGPYLPQLILGHAYTAHLSSAGGNGGTPSWTAKSALPKGLTLSSAGVLSGTVNAANVSPGTYHLTIQVSETHAGMTEKYAAAFTLKVVS